MSGFVHSVKVPNQYRKAAKTLQNAMENDASIKHQIFNEKHAVRIEIDSNDKNTKNLFAIFRELIVCMQ